MSPRHQHATHTCPADGPCALPVLYQESDGLWRRGGPSRSGQTPRTPRPPPFPGHTTRSPRARPPSRPFRNVDAPPAAVQPPPSPPCSVYHSLSIVQVGVVPPPGAHGPPASGLPTPRRRAQRAPPGHRRAPGGLPARGGGGRRRRGPAAVRRARVPGVPDVRRVRTRCGAVSVRGLRARAPGTVLVQRAGVVSQLWWSPDDGARRASGGRGAAVGAGHDRKGKEVSFRRPPRTIFPSDSRSLSTCLTVLFLSPSEKYDVAHLSLCFVRSSLYHSGAGSGEESVVSHRASQRRGVKT